MLSGGLAAASTLFVTYPMDLARVKLATDLSVEGKRQYSGTIDIWKKVVASDGVSGLYRGMLPAVGSIFLERGTYIALFDLYAKNMVSDQKE